MSVGVKYDNEKPRWSLLPTELLWGVVEVLEHGARKYSPNNWMHVPNGVERYADAAARHLAAIERGELNDPDSGLPHAYHYLCSAIFVAWKALNRPDELRAWRERGSVVVPVEKPWTPPSPAAIDARWLADQADEAALRAERLDPAGYLDDAAADVAAAYDPDASDAENEMSDRPELYIAKVEYKPGDLAKLAEFALPLSPDQHEHVFELCDSGTSPIRKWVCKCGESVTHENGTNIYKRHFRTFDVSCVKEHNTYFAATRAR